MPVQTANQMDAEAAVEWGWLRWSGQALKVQPIANVFECSD